MAKRNPAFWELPNIASWQPFISKSGSDGMGLAYGMESMVSLVLTTVVRFRLSLMIFTLEGVKNRLNSNAPITSAPPSGETTRTPPKFFSLFVTL